MPEAVTKIALFLVPVLATCLYGCSARESSFGEPYVIRPCTLPNNADLSILNRKDAAEQGITPPEPKYMPAPSYNVEAVKKQISGEVVLKVLIDAKGDCIVCEVIQSIPELDEAAIKVVEASWLFEPAKKNGKPMAILAEIVVSFNLE